MKQKEKTPRQDNGKGTEAKRGRLKREKGKESEGERAK